MHTAGYVSVFVCVKGIERVTMPYILYKPNVYTGSQTNRTERQKQRVDTSDEEKKPNSARS